MYYSFTTTLHLTRARAQLFWLLSIKSLFFITIHKSGSFVSYKSSLLELLAGGFLRKKVKVKGNFRRVNQTVIEPNLAEIYCSLYL